MTETTTHCDYCGNPLGVKCDRTAASAVRAKLNGIFVCSKFLARDLEYGFFCNAGCSREFIRQTDGKFYGEKKIHETQDEKEISAKIELDRITPSNEELKRIAENFPAPQEWYDEE